MSSSWLLQKDVNGAQPPSANATYFAHSSMNLKEFSHGRAAAGQIPPPYSRAEENARELNGRSE
ncbi:MAG: hypothetical protein DMG65_06385 [Candidatus Angelobacter sp. Gp1-AA117]|nr:MAG: hypothetical protein DMG65_06385 [Candidatus Angelobacter sp. Gp1-AA117]